MSPSSTSSSLSNEPTILAKKISVSSNIAKDGAFQMNVGCLKFETLVINCEQFELAAQKAAPRTSEGQRIGVTSINVTRPDVYMPGAERNETVLKIPTRATLRQPDIKWVAPSRRTIAPIPKLTGRYMKLYCRSTGEYNVVWAKIDPSTTEAFIARRLVNGFGLSASGRGPTSSLGDYVDLTCDMGPGKAYESYRFYVLEGCTFDVCIGLNPSKLPAFDRRRPGGST